MRVIGLDGDAAGELAVRWICTTGTAGIAADTPAATWEAAAANAACICGGATTGEPRTMGDAMPPPRACVVPSMVAAAIAEVVLGAEVAMEPEAAGIPGTQDRGDIVGMCDKPSCAAEERVGMPHGVLGHAFLSGVGMRPPINRSYSLH